jgi:hypothetical protein
LNERAAAPPPPNPKDVADAQAKEAQAAKYQADAQRAGAETAKTVVETQQMQLETQRMQEAHAVRQAIGQQIMAELPTQPGQTMFQQPLSIQP